MRLPSCRACALAGLFSLALAVPAAAAPAADPVRLLAPTGGTELRAGSLAEIAWEADAPWIGSRGIEEWEAFLSLDGGAHYTVRITPHLDLGLRRVLWRVPPAPTADARLLLRFGDEHQETVLELPQRFSIAGPVEPGLGAVPVEISLRRGEPARPDESGVVAWVEGDRAGGRLRSVVAAEPPAAHAPCSVEEGQGREVLAVAPPGPPHDPAAARAATARVSPPSPRAGHARAERPIAESPLSILLLTSRRNE
jgi:hypothetical protein